VLNNARVGEKFVETYLKAYKKVGIKAYATQKFHARIHT
jgi:hypothetical protein